MTEAELLASAAKHAKAASIPLDDWIRRLSTGVNYPWKQTEWGKAMLALEQLRTPAPKPNPGPLPTHPYGTAAEAAPFAGRGIMLGSNPDVWGQALDLAKQGHLEVAAVIPSMPVSARAPLAAVCKVVTWCPPEVTAVTDIMQAENQTEWNKGNHLAPGIVTNWWGYGRFDGHVALVEAYYNEGWGVDFGIYANYTAQGAKAVIPVCGGYSATARSDVESARLYEALGKLPFPGFWMYAGESMLTAECVEVLKAWKLS